MERPCRSKRKLAPQLPNGPKLIYPYLCVDCGKARHGQGLFLWLPDHQWEQLGYEKDQYACAHCIINRVEKLEKDGEIWKYCTLVLDVGLGSFQGKNHVPIPDKTIRQKLLDK